MAQGRPNSKSNGGGSGGSSEGSSEVSRVGSAARIRGRVHGDGNLTIEGQVEGDIALGGELTIAAGGSAASNVEAESVVIAGTLEGDVSARGAVRILSGARVRGNLSGAQVSVEDGAELAGRLECEFELPAELMEGGREAGASAPSRGGAARRR